MLSIAFDMSNNTINEIFFQSIFFKISSEKWSKAVSVEWAWRFPLWNFEIFPNCSKNEQIDERLVFLQTFDNIGSKEIGRLITGSSKSPDLKIGITFATFHDQAKEPVANDLLNKRVITIPEVTQEGGL